MIGNICLILGLLFLWYGLILPLYQSTLQKQTRRGQESLRAQKTLAVRSYYPGLEIYTPRELREEFNIDEAYDQIGRFG